MIKKNKLRTRATGTTIRLHPKSRKLIANTVIRAINRMNTEQLEVRTIPQIKTQIEHKKMRILMVSSLNGETLWPIEQHIAEQLRLLAKELVSIKAFSGFSTTLAQLNPDLLLVVGSEEPFSEADLAVIRSSPVKKAIWLSDSVITNDSVGHLAALFDYVFTQNAQHLPFYLHSGCRQVMYLPFAADRSLFSPHYVEEECRSDILLIGDVLPGQIYILQIRPLLEGKKVYAAGNGWEIFPNILPIPPQTGIQDIYNGAEIIIHWGQPTDTVFNIAACGGFQLVEAHPNYYEYMNPGEDIAVFHSVTELSEKLQYYLTHPEAKRAAASRALWKSTYDYSFLQMAAKLLHTVFSG
ncbi:hypothetical protein C2I18_01295 [Paenibacillus sp. PK3_47]|uniref:glycosyltransferase family protein n=1 Tax=Paenibacillus sp. PK3_47 TaxID=2072642 RepID=UPI00201E6B80|nr:glycosyltransferase [Paenibacillus sp. PK3_47]UQZ32299.1 hypothetical protein C2I18_01295 [Paenibacillus sp. PK3_47]